MTRTYHGSCHCGAVAFAVELDLSQGTGRCNCSFCRKVRNWSVAVKPAAFTLQRGAEALREYRFRPDSPNAHCFCGTCGVRLFTRGFVEEIGGAYVSVPVSVLDDATAEEIIAAPVQWFDGLHDNWWHTPAEVRHL